MCGQKCTQFADSMEEAKAILKEIANKRALQSTTNQGSEEPGSAPHLRMQEPYDQNNTISEQNVNGGRRDNLEPMNLTFTSP